MKKIALIIGVMSAFLMAQSAFAQSYTSADVAGHTSASDCWMTISGKVYNVTPFINQHPGGKSTITSNCGVDATTAFNTKGGGRSGHSSFAASLLANYYTGDLAVATTNPTPTPTPTPAPTTMPLPTTPVISGTVTTPPTPSVKPVAKSQWRLVVEENGSLLLRGEVVAVSATSLSVKSWGGVWTVTPSTGAEVLPWKLIKGSVTLAHFQVGDFVGVQGYAATDGTLSITAKVVRNRTDHPVLRTTRIREEREGHDD